MKRGILDNMRLPSRPYRFEFESNEDEERAIAEAIAREEELMRQEEESKRGQGRSEHHWQHPRIINQYGQVGTNLFSQLSKQPLTYSSNLMPAKDDTPEQKSIKQLLDTIITQVCRWDKQHGWYKAHLKRPRNRFELDKLRKRMFSNQREVMLAQHVDRLRKEINKRRTALENLAEDECGLLTPWRKSKGRGQKVTKRQQSPEREPPRQVVNPAEISLGGDAVKWTDAKDLKKEEPIEDDGDIENLVEVQSPPRRNDRKSTNRWSPQPQKSPKKGDKLRKMKDDVSSAEESQPTAPSPRKRGRPPKRTYENVADNGSDDSDGGGRKKIRRPPPPGLDINSLHCMCQKKYNPYRFYLACSHCSNWYHGKCVGITEAETEELQSWSCPLCIRPVESGVQLYCKCQKEYNENQFYVGCDGCQGWFHPECVGITREFVEAISEYLCPDCNEERQRQEDGYDSVDSEGNNQTPLSRSDYPLLWKLLDQLCEHRMSWPFREPVNLDEFPDYTQVITRPMDLSVIQKKLENLEYHTLLDFADDVRLMLQNAKTYHSKGVDVSSTIQICAETLEKMFETQLIEVQNEIEARRTQDRRKASESRTIDSSLDIDTDQLIDVMVDPSMYEQLLEASQ